MLSAGSPGERYPARAHHLNTSLSSDAFRDLSTTSSSSTNHSQPLSLSFGASLSNLSRSRHPSSNLPLSVRSREIGRPRLIVLITQSGEYSHSSLSPRHESPFPKMSGSLILRVLRASRVICILSHVYAAAR
ncbi:unnamed protein product [Cyclocybe aegerita]|uniref:Uncharacterized protein n=1 Tax=Cyclocybe aegerita TaxID=1973307 RepID=A0A8S0WXZ0_CYCAE|nr:unnamed protein product [Cyclocybe aegerita]